jgi:hypothetical protein
MSAPNDPRRPITGGVGAEYYYRRTLSVRELLPAVGVGIGAGAVAFYIAKLLLERTPLQPQGAPPSRRLASARTADRLDVASSRR